MQEATAYQYLNIAFLKANRSLATGQGIQQSRSDVT